MNRSGLSLLATFTLLLVQKHTGKLLQSSTDYAFFTHTVLLSMCLSHYAQALKAATIIPSYKRCEDLGDAHLTLDSVTAYFTWKEILLFMVVLPLVLKCDIHPIILIAGGAIFGMAIF